MDFNKIFFFFPEETPLTSAIKYDRLGRLIHEKNVFARVSIGAANTVRYRCSEYRKANCKATLKTVGKKLITVCNKHSHDAKLKQ